MKLPRDGSGTYKMLMAIALNEHIHPDELRAQMIGVVRESAINPSLNDYKVKTRSDRYIMPPALRFALGGRAVCDVVPPRKVNAFTPEMPPVQLSYRGRV